MVPLLIMATSLVSKINTSVALLKGWVNSFLAFMGQLYLGFYSILWLPGQGQPAPTLSAVIGAYKSLTTVAWIRACNTIGIQGVGTFWLDDFYDRIIPNTTALQRIRHYIRQHPPTLTTRPR